MLRKLGLIITLLLILSGCGGGGGGSSVGMSGASSVSMNGTSAASTDAPVVVTTPTPTAVVSPGPTTARVTLAFTLAQAVPSRIDTYRVTGFDAAGAAVFGPQAFARAARIVLTVPVTVKRLRIEYIHLGTVEGLSDLPVDLAAGGETSFTDPDVERLGVTVTGLHAVAGASVPRGVSVALTLEADMSDGTVSDVTSAVTWSTSDSAVATVSNAAGSRGRVTGIAPGTATVTATTGTLTSSCTIIVTNAELSSLAITPVNSSLPATTTQALTATGTYTDGTTRDLSAQVSWTTGSLAVATVDASGVLTAVAEGTTPIHATMGTLTADAAVSVTHAPLLAVQVTPASPSLARGTVVQMVAIASYADGSTLDVTSAATWTSVHAGVAAVSNATGSVGRVTGIGVGTTDVTATFGGVSQTRTLTVTDATLDAISVTPIHPSVAVSSTETFTATGLFSDGTTQDVTALATWSSSAACLSLSSNVGTGASSGQATITATIGQVSGETSVTVIDAPLASIAVTSATPTVPLGTGVRLRAVGTYADGTTIDLTSQVTWASGDAALSVSNAAGCQGRIFAAAASGAPVTVTATLDDVQGTATATISSARLERIDVTPTDALIHKGTSQSYSATGIYSDGTTSDLTASVSWVSSKPATVPLTGSTAAGAGPDQALIQATLGTVTGATTLTVTDARLDSVAVTPVNPTAAKGTQIAFTVTGTYSDGTTQDLTSSAAWSSSDDAVAAVSSAAGSQGQASGLSQGAATVTATVGGLSATSTLTVSPATLERISVTPPAPAVAKGTEATFTATGVYSDGTTQDLTSAVTWSPSSSAAVMTGNLAEGAAVGQADVTATFGGVSGKTVLTVTDATLVTIAVTPAAASAARGTKVQLVATGTFTDGSTQDLSSLVTWSSTAAASVSNAAGSPGLATALNAGTATVSATRGSVSGSTTLTVTSATLTRIDVSPPAPLLAKGTSTALTATGVYSDGSTQDLTGSASWTSSSPAVTMSTSTANGVAVGAADAVATVGGVSGRSRVTVTDASLVSLAVSPPTASIARGLTVQLTAVGTFSDGTTQDLTSSASWTASAGGDAGVSPRGLVTGLGAGGNATTISATFGSVSGSATVDVTGAQLMSMQLTPPNPVIVKGVSVQLTATGLFSTGATANVTGPASWSVSDPTVVALTASNGQLVPLKAGQAVITATLLGVTATTTVTVREAQISDLTLSTDVATMPRGRTTRLAVTASFTDGTTADVTGLATWSASNGNASVSNASGARGTVTALNVGTSLISCSLNGITSDTCQVTVTSAVLQALAITPVAPLVAVGTTQQMTCTGTYSDATTQNLTAIASWSSASTAFVTIDAGGLATALVPGSSVVTATFGGLTATQKVAVREAALTSITVTPATPSVAKGFTRQLIATGTYADGSTQDLTSLVTWTSGTTSVATISNAAGSRGLATTATSTGTSTITATLGSVSGNTVLTVTAATLQSIAVTPAAPVIVNGTTQALTATGNFSDGTTADLTSTASWTSGTTSVATVSANVATGKTAGTSTITATSSGVQGRTNLTVRQATLVSIALSPSTSNVNQSAFRQFTATGTFSDGTTQDITSSATWTSNDTTIATVSNAADSKGTALGILKGLAQIRAALAGVTSGAASLNVLAAITQVLADDGSQPVGGPSTDGDISDDGGRVAILSNATNLVSGDTNDQGDAFVRDMVLGRVTRLNLTNGTTEVTLNTNQPSHIRISGDGNWAVFDNGGPLVTADSNSFSDVYRSHVSVSNGQLVMTGPELVSRVGLTGAVGDNTSLLPGISDDGNLVVFTSRGTNINGNSGVRQALVKDMTTGTIDIVSRADGASGALSESNATFPNMSRDGRFVSFRVTYLDSSHNLDPTYTPIIGAGNQYVRDRVNNKTFRLARPGLTSGNASPLGGINASFSDDGKVIAFDSDYNDIVPGDTNNLADIFVFEWDGADPSTGVITRVSVQDVSQGGGQAVKSPFVAGDEFGGSFNASISGNGRWIVYNSTATNLDPLLADTNQATDVFVYDRVTRQTRRLSTNANGTQAVGSSQGPRISRDGAYVIFQSGAPLSATDTNGQYDEYVVPNPLYQ